jgi:hypothetical protein
VQQYNDPVTLGANTSFTGAGVAFGTTLQGSAKTLSIVAGATGVSFGGNVGTVPEPLGAIDVGSIGVVTISGDIYSTGPVVIRSSGYGITMADGAVVDAGAGTILLSAAGDIGLGGLTTTNATANAVKVNSTGGAILDAGDADTDIVAAASGALVTLKAATGIGTSNAIEINASSAEAATTAGGIGLSGVGNLSIGLGGLSAPPRRSLRRGGHRLLLDLLLDHAREHGDDAGHDWADNCRRFAALGRAAADIAGGAVRGRKFDLLHAHDWQAGLAPAYLRFAPPKQCRRPLPSSASYLEPDFSRPCSA